jgi:Xaa-Pro aminopeptidase
MNQAEIASWAVARLRQVMHEEGIGLCVVADPLHVTYLTGYLIAGQVGLVNSTAFVLVLPQTARLVAPESAGFEPPSWLELTSYPDYAIDRELEVQEEVLRAFERALPKAVPGGKVAAELGRLPAEAYELLGECRGVEAIVELGPRLRRLRQVKCALEVEAIRAAVRAAEKAFESVAELVRAGDSELDAYLACVRAVAEQAGGPAILDGDFVCGERSERIGGPPTNKALNQGELLIVDIYPRLGAYWADVTRTFVAGQPATWQVERHALLEEALAAGERAIEPGLPVKELYGIVRSALERGGLGAHFPHHAGHGVGLSPSEGPRIIPGSNAILQPGMVITLEPGLYVPGEGGMRLEDNFLVTERGAECLSRFPRALVSLGS